MSDVQQFDPTAFLTMPTTEESVKRPPIAAGDYFAVIKELKSETWQSKDKVDPGTGKLKSGIKLIPVLALDVPQAEATRVGLMQPTLELTDSIMLELNSAGTIDYSPGKNGALRRYRDATDLNKKGETFFPQLMVGKMVKVKIGHREYNGDLFEQIEGVSLPR